MSLSQMEANGKEALQGPRIPNVAPSLTATVKTYSPVTVSPVADVATEPGSVSDTLACDGPPIRQRIALG
jgi:hypothetical protein